MNEHPLVSQEVDRAAELRDAALDVAAGTVRLVLLSVATGLVAAGPLLAARLILRGVRAKAR